VSLFEDANQTKPQSSAAVNGGSRNIIKSRNDLQPRAKTTPYSGYRTAGNLGKIYYLRKLTTKNFSSQRKERDSSSKGTIAHLEKVKDLMSTAEKAVKMGDEMNPDSSNS
jgi:hypothetical protein